MQILKFHIWFDQTRFEILTEKNWQIGNKNIPSIDALFFKMHAIVTFRKLQFLN